MDEAQRAQAVARHDTTLPPLLLGLFCPLPRCFLQQGRKTGVSPPGTVLPADVTATCVREKTGRNLKAHVATLEKELFERGWWKNGDKHNEVLHKSSSRAVANTNKRSALRSSRIAGGVQSPIVGFSGPGLVPAAGRCCRGVRPVPGALGAAIHRNVNQNCREHEFNYLKFISSGIKCNSRTCTTAV